MIKLRIRDIIIVAAEQAAILPGLITGSRGNLRVLWARKAVYLLARQQGYYFTVIAKAINRDHSTVVHGYHVAKELYDTDRKFAGFVETVRARTLALTPKVPPERIVTGRVIPRRFQPLRPRKAAVEPQPSPPAMPDLSNDMDLLSHRVAAHYAGASV